MQKIAAVPGARESLTPSTDDRPVAIVGFGLLGEAFAVRLRAAGLRVAAFDTSPVRRERIGSLGFAAADELAAAARGARCALLTVYDAAQALGALRQLAVLGEPLDVLCATTLAPEDARALAAECESGPLRFVELPVSGSSLQVLAGRALALVGSAAPLAPQLEAVIDAICPVQVRVGPHGAAACLKLVINLVLEINRAALAEGFMLACEFDLDLDVVEQTLKQSAAASRVMDLQAPKMRNCDFTPHGRLEQSLKDMDAMLADGRERFLPVGAAARELLAAAVRAGDGVLDTAAIVRELGRRVIRAEAQPC